MKREAHEVQTGDEPEARYANYFHVGHNAFEVVLEFNAAVFTGQPLYLDLGVRTNGSGGAFTELRMTRDAWNDIHAAREVLRDPGTAFSVSFDPGGQARIEPSALGGTVVRVQLPLDASGRARGDERTSGVGR